MRIPPLLADFIYNRGCELKCEKFLTRPATGRGFLYLGELFWAQKREKRPALCRSHRLLSRGGYRRGVSVQNKI